MTLCFFHCISDCINSIRNKLAILEKRTTVIEYRGYLFRQVSTYWKEIEPATIEWYVNGKKVTFVDKRECGGCFDYFAFAYLPYDERDSVNLSEISDEELRMVKILGSESLFWGCDWHKKYEQLRSDDAKKSYSDK